MNITQLLIQTGVTFIAAALGAIFGAYLTRRTERFKHLQELRSAAYADFLAGFAKVGRAQQDGKGDARSKQDELEGRIAVTDSRSRIAIYGSAAVVELLARFIKEGTQTITPAGMHAFTELCYLMRIESDQKKAALQDLVTVLFS